MLARQDLLNIGFKEIPHMTVMNSLIFDLGRNRHLSIGCIGEPNEMIFICEVDDEDDRKITDLICIRNFDYDGYTILEDVKAIIRSITGKSV